MPDTCRPQPVEPVRHVVVDRLSGDVRDVLERPQTVRCERPPVRPDRAGVLHPAVEGGWAVVAAARDQRQPALRRLGQRARESDGAVRMAAASGRGGKAPENVAPPVDDRRGEDRHLDVRRQVPRDDTHIGTLIGLEQLPAARIGHAVEIDATRRPVGRRALVPQRERVALDRLAERVAHRLEQVVACGETRAVCEEAPEP